MNRLRLEQLFFSVCVYCSFVAVFIVVGIPLVCVLVAAPRRCYTRSGVVFWLLDIFYKSALASFLVPIVVTGEQVSLEKPIIIIGNHQSLIDIFLIGAMFNGRPHIWYALSYYAKMPIFGFIVRNLLFAVNPARPAEAARGFMRGLRHAEKYGLHLALFPEAGRFNDGTVHSFMRGFALAARTLQRPVVPIYMPYNGLVYLPAAWRVVSHRLVAFVGPEMYVAEQESDEVFVDRVYQWFLHLEENSNVSYGI